MSTESESIRAVGFTEIGGPEVLGVVELPMPGAGAGEVVVRVVAATVNPTDVLLRTGGPGDRRTLVPPYVPGMELAGYVHQVGDESISMLAGQPVMGIVTPRRPDRGAQAQYVCLPAASLCPLPNDMDLVDAATIPMNGLTAKMAVESLEASPGDTVLITGGAGALGGYSIQLAKVAGLYVIADAKESDRELLVALGADEIVPRDEGRAAALRAEHPNGVDGLIDAARVGPPAAELVRDGGVVVAVRTSDEIVDPRVRPRYVSVEEQLTNTDALAWLLEQVRAGRLTPRVAVRLPLAEAAEAHRLVERGGLRGRVVLLLDDDRTVDGTGPQTRPEFD